MTLRDGQSELDTAVIRLPDVGQQIANWESMKLSDSFLKPCAELSFVLSGEDVTQISELIVAGNRVELAVNDRIQLSGRIDKKSISYSKSAGTMVHVEARDILGPCVDSNAPPKLRLSEDMTLLDLVAAVVVPFGITTIYNDGDLNISIQTGATKTPSAAASAISVQLPKEELGTDGEVTLAYSKTSATAKTSSNKPDLRALKLKQTKPNSEEGAYQYMERMLKRFGFRVRAAADGSGIVVDRPQFDVAPHYTLSHSRSTRDGNIKSAELSLNWENMPSMVICTGAGSMDLSLDRVEKTVIAVNELLSCNPDGSFVQEAKDQIAQYPGAIVLPVRPSLLPKSRSFAAKTPQRPVILRDKESSTTDQMKAFARHILSKHQHTGFQLKYTLAGFTINRYPLAVNTTANVRDDILGVSDTLWILSRDFSKSRKGGTETHITLVLPHSLDLAE